MRHVAAFFFFLSDDDDDVCGCSSFEAAGGKRKSKEQQQQKKKTKLIHVCFCFFVYLYFSHQCRHDFFLFSKARCLLKKKK